MIMAEMNADQVRAMLAPLWAKNRELVLDRVGRVRTALVTGLATDATQSDVHALIGTLGTYGWPEGSVLLETIALCIARDTFSGRLDLIQQLDDLRATLMEA